MQPTRHKHDTSQNHVHTQASAGAAPPRRAVTSHTWSRSLLLARAGPPRRASWRVWPCALPWRLRWSPRASPCARAHPCLRAHPFRPSADATPDSTTESRSPSRSTGSRRIASESSAAYCSGSRASGGRFHSCAGGCGGGGGSLQSSPMGGQARCGRCGGDGGLGCRRGVTADWGARPPFDFKKGGLYYALLVSLCTFMHDVTLSYSKSCVKRHPHESIYALKMRKGKRCE